MIDQLLGRLLQSFMIDHTISSKLIWDDAQSSMGTFSGRSKCCFSFGLISKNELTVCDKIRAIRNVAAHEWDFDLSSSVFQKKALPALKALYDADHSALFNWREDDVRFMIVNFYASSCATLSMRLMQRAAQVKDERRNEWKSL